MFEPPIASSLNRPGRKTIDACISSPQFPQVAGMQCIRSAQKQIADAFCQAARFKFATDDFQTQDSGQFQASLKFTQEQGPDGLVGRWVEDNTGGSIFTRIVCTN